MASVSNFVISDLKPAQPIQGWQEFLEDGNGYYRTAVEALAKRKDVFTSEILYNIIAMAIEKFVMAALVRHGAMPDNHTMADLVNAMEENFPGSVSDIRAELLRLDTYQEICDPEGFSITPPGMEKIPAMIDLAGKMQTLVVQKIIS